MNFARFIGYAHGLFWKLAALFSKFLFLILIVPKLPDTVYAEYIFALTITLFPGLLLSLGASEHLPIIIKGDRRIMDHYAPIYNFYLLACAALLAFYLFSGSWVALLLCVAATHMVYFILAGLLRSVDPGHYEWLTNQPTILFLLACFVWNTKTVEELVLLFIITNLMVYIPIAMVGGVKFAFDISGIMMALKKLVEMSSRGFAKIMSNLLLTADMRALILAPKLLLKVTPSDSLAMAINIGESLWQLAMVVVNRNYAFYCKQLGTLASSLKSAALLMAGMLVVGVVLLVFDIPIQINKLDWTLTGWSVVFFAGMITLMELRYFLWSRALGQKWIFTAQILVVLIQVAIVIGLEDHLWMQASAIVMITGACLVLGLLAFLNGKGLLGEAGSKGQMEGGKTP